MQSNLSPLSPLLPPEPSPAKKAMKIDVLML